MAPTPRQMGVTVRKLRKAKNITQAELADRAGLTRELFDDRQRVLRAISDLSVDHIRVLQAIGAAPPNDPARSLGSPFQTIVDRLGRMSREMLDDAVADLESRRLITLDTRGLHTSMTRRSAKDLRNRLTRLGRRFLSRYDDRPRPISRQEVRSLTI